jgi:hypothetical protein
VSVNNALLAGMSLHDHDWDVDVVAPLGAPSNDAKAVVLVEPDGVDSGLNADNTFASTCVAERPLEEQGSDTATCGPWFDKDGQHFTWFALTEADNLCVDLSDKQGACANAREVAFRHATTQPAFNDLGRVVRCTESAHCGQVQRTDRLSVGVLCRTYGGEGGHRSVGNHAG